MFTFDVIHLHPNNNNKTMVWRGLDALWFDAAEISVSELSGGCCDICGVSGEPGWNVRQGYYLLDVSNYKMVDVACRWMEMLQIKAGSWWKIAKGLENLLRCLDLNKKFNATLKDFLNVVFQSSSNGWNKM